MNDFDDDEGFVSKDKARKLRSLSSWAILLELSKFAVGLVACYSSSTYANGALEILLLIGALVFAGELGIRVYVLSFWKDEK